MIGPLCKFYNYCTLTEITPFGFLALCVASADTVIGYQNQTIKIMLKTFKAYFPLGDFVCATRSVNKNSAK